MDVRWAGDESVFVLWARDGVVEIGLNGARRRQVVPEAKTFERFRFFDRLAVSPDAIAVGSNAWTTSWRPRKAGPDGSFLFHHKGISTNKDMDLLGDRLLFLGGAAERAGEAFAPDGAVAWLATLELKREDLQPVLYDAKGVGAPSLSACIASDLGAVRFLQDGSFVIVPGFQRGAHLFSPEGRQIRSWTSEELGLDSDCSSLGPEEEERLRMEPAAWQMYLNTHSVVDDILPLPQGPGLLVRSMGQDGRAQWRLKVLQSDRVVTYPIPVTGQRPFDRLHGDVHKGRIVLLLSPSGLSISSHPEDHQGEILFADIS